MMHMILEKTSKIDMIRAFGSLSLPVIIKSDFPSVKKLEMEHGLEKVEKVLAVMFHDLSSSFNGDLDRDAVEELCAEITSTSTRNLSMEDVYLVCRNITKAKNYKKLDLNIVMLALEDHLNTRSNLIYEANLNDHLSKKNSYNPLIAPRDIRVKMANSDKVKKYKSAH